MKQAPCFLLVEMAAGVQTLSVVFLSLLQSIIATSTLDASAINDCCTFEILQKGCSDTFLLEDGDVLACTLATEISLSGESCIELGSADKTLDDRGNPPQIELIAADPVLDLRCPDGSTTHTEINSQCTDYHGSTFIALKITFRILGAGNVSGVLFDLSNTGDVCHYLSIPDGTREDLIVNRIFSYTGFVGLHPGSEYLLRATPLTAGESRDGYSELAFSISDCTTLTSWIEDYYCSLPSPANWIPKILLQPHSLDVTFTIWPEVSAFTTYYLYLLLGDQIEETNKIERISFITSDPANIKTKRIGSQDYQVMHHEFDVDIPPGQYTLAVLPWPDDACSSDSHWGSNICQYSKKTIQYTRTNINEWILFKVPSTYSARPPSPEITRNSSSVITSSSPTDPPDLEPLFLGIIIFLLIFVILLMIGVVCYCNDRTISRYLVGGCKDLLCNGCAPDIDTQTVTSSWFGNQYQPVILKRPPLPGELCTYSLDDVIFDGTTTPTTCSETTSDSMSQVLPVNTKKGRHAKGSKHRV